MKTKELSKFQMEEIFGVCMDRTQQEFLIRHPEHKDAWMLSYVFDSKLRKEMEERYDFLCKEINIYKELQELIDAKSL